MYQNIINFIKKTFNTEEFIPLHNPIFNGNEKKYLNDCIDSTFVSSVGKYVSILEKEIAAKVGTNYAIATCSGTAALHISLMLSNVNKDDEVITQPVTFIATCNAISYIGAKPIFVDVDLKTMGLCPKKLKKFLNTNCVIKDKKCINKHTNKTIKACIAMHTFGHPCKIDEIKEICDQWNINLIEDAAESLGSYYKKQHTGTFGKFGIFSFNGNKIITSGGGGVIVTNDSLLAEKAKHLTTTAKIDHKWEYIHDQIAYNYRMPNINAALLLAQLEQIETFIKSKRDLANIYEDFFKIQTNIKLIKEPEFSQSNYWLQSLLFENSDEKELFLKETNDKGIMTRPIWRLINKLEPYKNCQISNLENSLFLEKHIVNIPSSARINK